MSSGSMPLAFGAILTGGWLLDRGSKDVKAGLASSSSQGTGGGAGPSPGASPGTHGLVTTAALDKIGRSFDWGPSEIDDWMKVVATESNGTLTDTNPSSQAYGIAQFNVTPGDVTGNIQAYYTYGGNPNTLIGQLTAMANYIHQRYGSPSAAWAHEQAHSWY